MAVSGFEPVDFDAFHSRELPGRPAARSTQCAHFGSAIPPTAATTTRCTVATTV
jgi:hypothetical protein